MQRGGILISNSTSKGRQGSRAQALKNAGFTTVREFRSAVAKLKDKGLTRVDARSQKPTRHMLTKVREFADVRAGRAHVLTVKSKDARDRFRTGMERNAAIRVSGNKVVIPRKVAKETVRFDKRSGSIKISRDEYGVKAHIELVAARNFGDLFAFETRSKKKHAYTIVMFRAGHAERFRFATVAELYKFLAESPKLLQARDNLAKYVEIEDYDDEDSEIEEE